MRRRAFLASTLAALAGCNMRPADGGETSTPARTTVSSSALPEPDDPPGADGAAWERAAEERIDRHRRTDLVVEAVDAAGDPLADVPVSVTLRSHAVRFGTAYNVARFRGLDADHPYRRYVGDLFNEAVLENAYKWRRWVAPDGHERTHPPIEFLRRSGVTVSGAPVVWQRPEAEVMPESVWEAMEADDPERLRRLVTDHVERIVGHYAGDHDVTHWVLLNEQLGANAITDYLTDAAPERAPPLREWFATAREAAPEATLSVNDYDTLTGDRPAFRDRYADLVSFLAGGEAPPDEVGFQGHHTAADERIAPAELYDRLERFADLGDHALAVTEFDTPGIADEAAAGAYLYRYLKTAYSHPRVTGFRLWGFWDEQHWAGNAPLFRADWTPKPAYDAYASLLFDQWHTDASGRTDAEGCFRIRADLGRYGVRVEGPAGPRTVERAVTDPDGPVRVRVRAGDGDTGG